MVMVMVIIGTRTQRKCNPVAWNKGMVMAKCGGCEKWHKLKDEGNLVDVIPYASFFFIAAILFRHAIDTRFTVSSHLLRYTQYPSSAPFLVGHSA